MVENDKNAREERNMLASLEILSIPARGTALDISLNKEEMIRFAEAGSEALKDNIVARLHRCWD